MTALMKPDENVPDELVARVEALEAEVKGLEKDVKEAERAKNEYMQNVAHQLAAPINAIKMNIESLDHPRISLDRKRGLLRPIYAHRA